jgi:hypothetical protein
VARENGLRSSWACIAWYSDDHACISMLISSLRGLGAECGAGHRQFRGRR